MTNNNKNKIAYAFFCDDLAMTAVSLFGYSDMTNLEERSKFLRISCITRNFLGKIFRT